MREFVRRVARAWDALAPEQRMAAAAALAMWVSMFLPWYGKSVTESVKNSLKAAGYNLTAFGAFSFVEAAVLLVSAGVLAMLFARDDDDRPPVGHLRRARRRRRARLRRHPRASRARPRAGARRGPDSRSQRRRPR
jgi:hypothetical protein